jgi:tetratricopeptide (TPR) repeat protein
MAKIRKRRLFLLITSIVIVLLLAAGGYWWFTEHPRAVVPEKITKALGSTADAQNQRAVATQQFTANKDTAGGLAYYDDLLQHTTNPSDKRSILLEKAWFAMNMKQYTVALDSANQAEAIKKDTSTALRKAQIYEQMGDKKSAIAQYNDALAMASSDTSGYSARYSYQWKLKIEELSQ